VAAASAPGVDLLLQYHRRGRFQPVSMPLCSNAAKVYFKSASASAAFVREVGKRDQRLDHPELGEAAAGV
jgi:hypothetical protein